MSYLKTITIKQFATRYSVSEICLKSSTLISNKQKKPYKPKQVAQPQFQRNVVWDDRQNNQFWDSLFKGMALSPMVIADILSCMENADGQENEADFNIFGSLLEKDYQYSSIDGQNRSACISSYLNDLRSPEIKKLTSIGAKF